MKDRKMLRNHQGRKVRQHSSTNALLGDAGSSGHSCRLPFFGSFLGMQKRTKDD
jgi:hypothetical protein